MKLNMYLRKIIVNSAIHALKADKLQQKDSTTTYVSAKELNIGGDTSSLGGRNKDGYVQTFVILCFMFYVFLQLVKKHKF